jgi:hypothetical protein
VKAAIREGTAKHLDSDRVYERVSSKAAAASKEFADYVRTASAAGPNLVAGGRNPKPNTAANATPVSSPLMLAFPLADIGIKLWKAHREKVAAERQAAADGFSKDAAWKPWSEVGSSRPGL